MLEACDGKEGIKVSSNSPADLVITDIIMPEKEGIETIIELRQMSPEMKIIAISGGGRIGAETYLNIAKKFGAAFTFAKPIDRKELLDAIQEILRQP